MSKETEVAAGPDESADQSTRDHEAALRESRARIDQAERDYVAALKASAGSKSTAKPEHKARPSEARASMLERQAVSSALRASLIAQGADPSRADQAVRYALHDAAQIGVLDDGTPYIEEQDGDHHFDEMDRLTRRLFDEFPRLRLHRDDEAGHAKAQEINKLSTHDLLAEIAKQDKAKRAAEIQRAKRGEGKGRTTRPASDAALRSLAGLTPQEMSMEELLTAANRGGAR